MHQLLLYAVFGEALVAFLEVFHRGNVVLELLRCTLTLLQGSWFWQVSAGARGGTWRRMFSLFWSGANVRAPSGLQIGFVLYPPRGPEWDLDDHSNVMFVTMCFSWHLASAMLAVSALHWAVSW